MKEKAWQQSNAAHQAAPIPTNREKSSISVATVVVGGAVITEEKERSVADVKKDS